MKKLIVSEFVVLLLGTMFAWGNFGVELNSWLHSQSCPTGCVVGVVNPFYTPCFYGALFFTLAFILSAVIFAKTKRGRI
jgi:hypothetical protein